MLSLLIMVLAVMLFHAQFGDALGALQTPVFALGSSGNDVTTALYAEAYRPQSHFTRQKLDERSQRAHLLCWRIPPLLSIQPARNRMGTYELGARRQSGSGALETSATRSCRRERRDDVFRQHPCGLAQYQRPLPRQGGRSPVMYGCHLHYTGRSEKLQTQNLAYSNDKGRNWTKYTENPVIDLHLASFRDPKVFWYEPAHKWVMVTALGSQHKVKLFGSTDLKHWIALSDFGPAGATGGAWECHDLFSLPVDGDASQTMRVLSVNLNPGGVAGGSGNQYFIGSFDGTNFSSNVPAGQILLGGLRRRLLRFDIVLRYTQG
jgi:hypothetical protein